MNLLVLSFDGLHSGFLGYAGCTWTQTPSFDRLAAEGLVFDKLFADRLEQPEVFSQLWTGNYTPRRSHQPGEEPLSLAKAAAKAGYITALVSDDEDILSLPSVNDFQIVESAVAEPSDVRNRHPADSVDDTDAVRVFSSIASLLDNLSAGQAGEEVPFFCWAHVSTLTRLWDAPQEYRSRYTEEGDPEPLADVAVPNRILPEYCGQFAPDEQLQIAQTYAGQMSVIDECLAALQDYLSESGLLDDTAVLLISTRGIGLGEHGLVGCVSPSFYTEYARLTAILRIPDQELFLRRTEALTALSDFHGALMYWFEDHLPGEVDNSQLIAGEPPTEHSSPLQTQAGNMVSQTETTDQTDIPDTETTDPEIPGLYSLFWDDLVQYRDRILGWNYKQRVVQTSAWRYLFTDSQPHEGELYVMPDDRWEVNNVAGICESIVEKISAVDPTTDLAPELTNVWH